MSIIHEALKKASRDESPETASEERRKARFYRPSSFSTKNSLLKFGFLFAFFGVMVLLYEERSYLTRLLTMNRVQPEVVSSKSKEHSEPPVSVPRAADSEPTPRAELSTKSRAVSHEKLGVEYLGKNQLIEAERELVLAAALDPDSSVIQSNLGLVLQKQGRDGEAESRYESALKLDSENVQAMNNLGFLYEQQNRFEEAKRLYQKAVMIRPDFPDPHLNFAVLLERAGYLEEAKRHYHTFLGLAGPKHDKAVELVKKHVERLP